MNSPESDSKRGKNGEGPSTSQYMTTFSDLITLLLTFFVLLFSMSSMDDQKLKIAFHNFGGSSGILSYKEYREISRPMEILINNLQRSLGERVSVSDQVISQEANADTRDFEDFGNKLFIQPVPNGIKLAFGDTLLFSSGGIEIKEEMRPVLDRIARFISLTGYQAYIDGHTDNVPVKKGKYGSNEELSIARAFRVRDQLAGFQGINPGCIAVAGYGDIKPVASNDFLEGRRKNRRVEIILKNQTYF